MAAIEEVKSGMSALQASRKYGVPSRTLYDKVSLEQNCQNIHLSKLGQENGNSYSKHAETITSEKRWRLWPKGKETKMKQLNEWKNEINKKKKYIQIYYIKLYWKMSMRKDQIYIYISAGIQSKWRKQLPSNQPPWFTGKTLTVVKKSILKKLIKYDETN